MNVCVTIHLREWREVLATRGNVFVAGEITSGYEPPVFDVIRKVLEECGYCTDGIEMDTFVHQQSPDIAKAVSVSKEFRDNIGAKLRDRSRSWRSGCYGRICV